ncbi:uncharacterized protein LOC134762766 [Penaeus indicus]|uniref:uncharacterized protein LOC134762766 n=1 Tax=Penaeus indicus TaxID=29960 RepID=UPI00300D92CD
MAPFNINDFISEPSLDLLVNTTLKKDDWKALAGHYEIEIRACMTKAVIKSIVIESLVNSDILPMSALSLCDKVPREENSNVSELIELRKLELRKLELELQIGERAGFSQQKPRFDISKHAKLIPLFDEQDPEEFFLQFEKIAESLDWPEESWTVMIQTAFTGQAKRVFTNLPKEICKDYDAVKDIILQAYDLVPEAYRQKFRNLRKLESQTYVEYAAEKERLLQRWLRSRNVQTFTDLRSYLCAGRKSGGSEESGDQGARPSKIVKSAQGKNKIGVDKIDSLVTCFYCKQRGHVIAVCPKLAAKNVAKGATSLTVDLVEETDVNTSHDVKSDIFEPFIFTGLVASDMSSDKSYPVRILRDTASSQSVLVKASMPFVENSYTGEFVVIRGFGGTVTLPLARIFLRSDLVDRYITVGVHDFPLPVSEATLLLGNDVAGECVVPDPIVRPVPSGVNPTESLENEYPYLFPSCAVTRSVSKRIDKETSPTNVPNFDNLTISSLFNEEEGNEEKLDSVKEVSIRSLPITRDMLIDAQRKDKELCKYFSLVDDSQPLDSMYYLNSGVLMRKYRPVDVPATDTFTEIHQVVVPFPYRQDVISLAHDINGGHLGVSKTYFKILKHFYWPKMKKDVSSYCKTCHYCQVAGKPNEVIPPAPLHPIPVVAQPFNHILIDCVGPLPKTKCGNQYLLTIMCATTRYPEAIPLRNLTAKSVVKALTKFFTQFGIPNKVQSDQGANFTSGLFQQVMNELSIKQYLSTAYHPESQGALERFHQTFKCMLRKYCVEVEKDWDEGVHVLLFAIRESKQESLGFSPFELVYGHEVRGPLKLLKESWVSEEHVMPLLKYVHTFKERLLHVRDFAMKNLLNAQGVMKEQYDKKVEKREFEPGQLVLLFLPLSKNALQSKYFGPYRIKERKGDVNYVIETPDRRRQERLVHVNLIKPYHNREAMVEHKVLAVISETEEFCIDDPVKLNNSDILTNLNSKLQHLSSRQSEELVLLLKEFRCVCSDVPRPCRGVQHDIVLIENSAPIKQSHYRLSPEKRKKLREEVDFLLANGLAESSDSEWASPCLLVPKADGGLRLCTDYRKINKVTRSDSFPLPRLDDVIDGIGRAQFVTKIDLLKGYYQVELTENARRIAAFVTPDGLFEYKVMPFGLRNAPATFQRLINGVIRDLEGVQAYLDDLVITSDTWEEHLERLRALLARLAEAELTINLAKSEFGHAKVIFLGHVVGGGTVAPVTAKVEAILQYPTPTDRKSLQRFLGMAGYYRRFCPNFAHVSAPLTDLISPKKQFTWTSECQESFEKIRAMLTSPPVLTSPDFEKPFCLHIDASDSGAGAVLLQAGPDGVEVL